LDVAIQKLGSIETAFALASENAVSITDDLTTGSSLTLTDVQNLEVVSAYVLKSIVPATGLSDKDTVFGGINYMGIQLDLIVS